MLVFYIFSFFIPFLSIPAQTYANTTTLTYGVRAVNAPGPNAAAWWSLANAQGNTTTTSSSVLFSGNGKVTDALVLNNFNFASQWITNSSTINGIEIQVEYSSNSKVADNAIQLTKDWLVWVWTNVATNTPNNAKAFRSYGSSTDLWGTTWSGNDILSSNFGIYINFISTWGGWSHQANVFRVTMTVHHTPTPDTNAPVISLVWSTPVNIVKNATYVDAGATASDIEDGDLTANITTVNPVNTGVIWTYNVTYNVSDAAGNAATQVTRVVNVVAWDAPVISLSWTTPITLEVGSSYTDAWATATDSEDGDISLNIVSSGSVDTNTVGTYTISYDVTDSSDNIATQVSRTVNIVDTTAPSAFPLDIDISWGKDNPIVSFSASDNVAVDHYEISFDGGAFTTQTSPHSASLSPALSHTVVVRAYDTAGNFTESSASFPPVVNITAPTLLSNTGIADTTISIEGPTAILTIQINGSLSTNFTCWGEEVPSNTLYSFVGTQVPPISCSGWVISATSTLDVTVSDGVTSGNSTQNYVIDSVAPVITLSGSGTINVIKWTGYSDVWATCSDNYDTSCSVTLSGSVDINTLGTYTLTYDAVDAAWNNATQVTRTVNVVTWWIPTITLTGTTPITLEVGGSYIDAWATASDAEDGDISGSIVVVNPVNTSVVWAYTVSYDVDDATGNSAPQVTRTVNIVDTTIPIIALTGTTPINVAQNSTYTDAWATCSDNYDVSCTVVPSGTVDTSIVGEYILLYNATDANGNAATQVSRTVNVVAGGDTTPPVITLSGSTPVSVVKNATYSDAGATANDNTDGNITANIITVNPVNAGVIWAYTVTYDVSDAAGNTATQVIRTVNVVTGDIPVINLVGSGTVNITQWSSYTDAWATANDTEDGDISGSITSSWTVDTATIWTYIIEFDVTDSSDNAASQVSRTVNVTAAADTIPPVITLAGSWTISQEVWWSYSDAWATWSDNVDGTGSLLASWSVDTATVGSYILTYDYTDVAGNPATQESRTVNIVDTTAPVITRTWPSPITLEIWDSYSDLWATWVDNYDGTGSLVAAGWPVTTAGTGSFTLTYDYTDANGNAATQVTRIVNVVDTTPPVLALSWSSSITIAKNATYADAWASASDNLDWDITADIVTVNPVNTSIINSYTVTYDVDDASGNAATQISRTVNVVAGNTPVITLSWSGIITQEVGSSYMDAGASYSDTEDGTGSLVASGSVDINTLWSYTLTYDFTDSSNNAATQISRTVNIVDTTAPIITRNGVSPINLIQGDSYTDAWATCSDNYDISCGVTSTGNLDLTAVGVYTFDYNSVDSSWNDAAQINRTVNVAAAKLLINEVEYDTAWVENDSEWFEIHNPNAFGVKIHNWTITEKVGTGTGTNSYTFSGVTVPAGWYYLIVNDTTEFQNLYPGVTPDLDLPGTSYLGLKNSPDDYLELHDSLWNSIDFVAWEDSAGGWDLNAVESSICRTNLTDTDTWADWSDQCSATPWAINTLNSIPTNITLSWSTLNENGTSGDVVGWLTTTDANTWDTHTYSLVSGSGSDNNTSFSLSGALLIANFVADYETKNSYNVRVMTDDGKWGTYQKALVIFVNNLNNAPADITLSGSTINENNSIGDIIGQLTWTDDGEDNSTLTFSLACSTPGTDDSSFQISGTNLQAWAVYDFETKSSYNICIRVSDGVATYDENFSISIGDLDENLPVITITAPTKLNNASITDTTINVTDDIGVLAANVAISGSWSATISSYSCTQSGALEVNCSISIDSSGDIIISASDTSSNTQTASETNYVIDSVAPNIPNVIVNTDAPYSVDWPHVSFSSLDNIAVDRYTVTYNTNNSLPVTVGLSTTLDPATSPVVLDLDPDESLHVVTVTVYDSAWNSSQSTVRFPPNITFNAPTTLSNTTITDSTVTISTPTWNDITNIILTPNTTGASLWTCTWNGGDTTDPYATPVVCSILNIASSWTVTVSAEDNLIVAQASNSQSYIIDIVDPIVSISAPTKLKNASITDTTISITDDNAISVGNVTVSGTGTATTSSFSCSQTNVSRVDCTITIDDSGDLIISATDTAGNNVSKSESNYVIDTTAPTLTLLWVSPQTVEYNSVFTDLWATYTDNIEGTWSVVWSWSVNTWILGSYTISYDYTDVAGNSASQISRTVNVVDTTPPVIVRTWASPITVIKNATYSDSGATCSDNYDSLCSVTSSWTIDTNTVGSYTISYDAVDTNANVATQVSRTINVVAGNIPSISLVWTTPITQEVFSSYSDAWATASDDEDGDLTSSITTTNTVNTNIVGNYTVTYDVTDSSGNSASQVTRNLNIVDTTIPVISLNGAGSVDVEAGTSYIDTGAEFLDNYDGTGSVNGVWIVNSNAVWVFELTYDYTDTSWNTAAQVTRTVNVVDTTPAIISLVWASSITLEIGDSYSDLWAEFTDFIDGTGSLVATGWPVTTSWTGSFTLSYDYTDVEWNVSTQVTRIVNVVDTTIPTITLNGSGTVVIEAGAPYIDAGAVYADNLDGTWSITAVWTVDTSSTGSTTLTYDYTDTSSNVALQVTRTVNVVDTTPAVISLVWSGVVNLEIWDSYVDLGAEFSDFIDGTGSLVATGWPVTTSWTGSFTLSYDYTDVEWNVSTQVTRIVNVVDTTIPTITLNGSGTIEIFKNATYTDPGATAGDNLDGDISANIVVVNPVDTSVINSYTVTYNVSDISGNTAIQVTRTVNVIAGNIPTIILNGSGSITQEVGSPYSDLWAIYTDIEDGSWNIIASGSVNINTPGEYTLYYDYIDSSDNAANQITRTVRIVDTTIPTILLNGSGTVTVEAGALYVDEWAEFIDNLDGTWSIVAVWTVDTSSTGSTTLTYDYTDANNNAALQITRTVNVVDTTSAVIALIWSGSIILEIGDNYIDSGAEFSDFIDGTWSLVATGWPVTTSSTGSFILTYNYTDSSWNIATPVSRTVEVIDTAIPTISLNGSEAIDLEVGSSYVDLWAIFIDNVQGTGSIVWVWAVDTSTLWEYTLSYNFTDSSGNQAAQVTRTINIVDTTNPTITLNGSNSIILEVGDSYSDAWAIFSDNYDGTWNVVAAGWPVTTSSTGSFTLTYDYTDTSGNIAAQITRLVRVVDNASDTDGDWVPDVIEIEEWTNPSDGNDYLDTDGDMNPNYLDSDDDGDGTPDSTESSAPNNGDFNNDGTPDTLQKNVATRINPITSTYTSLAVWDAACWVNNFDILSESNLSVQDEDFVYPIWLLDFEIECTTPGSTAEIQIYLDSSIDSSSFVYKKFDSLTEIYTDISSIVSYRNETVWTSSVIVMSYDITDGDSNDEDGVVNGTIIDPSGPGVSNPVGGWVGTPGWRSYVCRDPEANNYEESWFSKPELCEYTVDASNPEDTAQENEQDTNESVEENIPNENENVNEEVKQEVEEITPEKWEDYIMQNDFASCDIIRNIQNPLYQFAEDVFSDISLSAQRANILKFAQIGIVDGYEDGTFGPSNEMTRTEFLKVALISHCYEYQNESTDSLTYTDIDKSSWQAKVIKKAESLWMINGDIDENGNSVFRPNDVISKAEAVKILMRLSLIDVNNPVNLWYTDITTSWHEKYVITGETLGLFDSSRDNGRFYPDSWVQRSSMIELVDNLVQLYK